MRSSDKVWGSKHKFSVLEFKCNQEMLIWNSCNNFDYNYLGYCSEINYALFLLFTLNGKDDGPVILVKGAGIWNSF